MLDVIEEWVWFYWERGFSVFPAKSTDPPSVDNKRPNISTWKRYITERPTKEEIQEWLDKKLFQNIAIVCGSVSGNIVVLDLDDEAIIPDLNLDLDKLIEEKGVWVQATGREGRYHLICRNNSDPGDTIKNSFVHLEYRANGAYIIACPSIHPSGKSYHFLNFEEPKDLPELKIFDVKTIFTDMVNRLCDKRGIQQKADRSIDIENIEAECIQNAFKGGLTEGRRNDTAFAMANWYKYVKKMNPTEVRTLLNNWNNRNNPPLPIAELNNIVTSAMKSEKKVGCSRWEQLGFCTVENKKDCKFINKPKKEKEKIPSEEKTKIIINDILYEQVYDPQTFVPQFVYLNEGHIKYVDKVEYNETIYLPVNDKKAVEMGAIYFPDRPVEYGSLQDLINEINTYIHKYLDISESYRTFCTWYIIFSWVTDYINTVPYLRVIGDFGSGKSRFINVVGKICYKPMIIAGATTSASIFRSIERWRGTLILEEYTPKESGEEEDDIKILNCGFEKGTPVVRCNLDNAGGKLDYFDCFGPKVISSRQEFHDEALNSRCLTEVLTETDREDIPIILPSSFYKEQQELRNKLLMFRLQHWEDIDPSKIQEVKFPTNISKRIKQAFASFVVLFAHDSGAFDNFMKFVEKYNEELIQERASSFDGLIINSFFELKNDGYGFVTSKMISESLEEKGIVRKDGGKISPATIGKHLKNLGLQSKPVKIEGRAYRAVVEDIKILNSIRNKYVVKAEELASFQKTFEN